MPGDMVSLGNGLELDRLAYELRRSGRALKLERIPMEILLVLVERRGQLVTREDIIAKVWGKDLYLDTDNSINTAIRKIRLVLKDDPDHPLFIQTVTGKGYRFIAQVGIAAEGVSQPDLKNTSRVTVVVGEAEARQAIEKTNPQLTPSGSTVAVFPQAIPAEEIVADPTREADAENTLLREPGRVPAARRGLKRRLLISLAVCSVITLFAAWLRPVARPPRVRGIRQITHLGTVALNQNLVATDSRIYFVDTARGENQLKYASLDGKTVSSVEKPFRTAELLDVLPSGDELLVGEILHEFPLFDEWHRAIWRLPVPDGVPRRVGNLFADDASWSPDGRTIAYTNEHDQTLNLVDGDGGNSRRLATFPGSPFKPRWSPDGKLIGISVADEKGPGRSLWQLDVSGNNLTRILPDTTSVGSAWAGRWTRDRHYFVFTGFQGGKKNIWALSETNDKRDFFRRGVTQPVQLTDGPLDFFVPSPSYDGKTIYAVGVDPHGELMRWNAKSRQVEPYVKGLSADNVAFSRDGTWMAYIAYPEGTLIRSRPDGSEALQLTFAPMRANQPRWSPDGSQIVFNGTANVRAVRKAYVVSANGGFPPLSPPGASLEQTAPDWSRDGQSIVYGSTDTSGSTWALHSLNLKTGAESVLPGTLGMGMGRVSPDGRYLAGLSVSGQNLLLYDTIAASTRKLAEFADYPIWSSDGKYIYYSNISRAFLLTPEKTGIFRVRVADANIERIVPAPSFSGQGNWGVWFGLAPDGSLLMFRNLATCDIYALDTDLL
jgi:Tol biopolymer transport system component/DNA-binding winged helix-turn-helix (wHTH) protein